MKAIIDTISRVKVGTPTAFRNLTIFPLVDGEGGSADYLTLDEALAQKSAKITEVSEGGSVPELKFVNDGDKPVLLLDGEELIGAKQNRVLNLSILAPACKTIIIPVSCVEAGRWHHRSSEFSSAPRVQYAEGRAAKMAQVSESMRHGSYSSDQGKVWADIGAKFGKFRASSPTSAMSDIYEQQSVRLDDYVRSFAPSERQAGAVFAIDGRVAGLELFDAPETLRKLFPKLLRSYALDALDRSMSAPAEAEYHSPTAEEAESFLKAVVETEAKASPALGEGQDVRLTGSGLTGAALSARERIVHLSAFQVKGRN